MQVYACQSDALMSYIYKVFVCLFVFSCLCVYLFFCIVFHLALCSTWINMKNNKHVLTTRRCRSLYMAIRLQEVNLEKLQRSFRWIPPCNYTPDPQKLYHSLYFRWNNKMKLLFLSEWSFRKIMIRWGIFLLENKPQLQRKFFHTYNNPNRSYWRKSR